MVDVQQAVPEVDEAPRRVSWGTAVRRARPRVKALNLGLLAAGVAFWALLSLVPAAIAVVMVYGLVRTPGEATAQLDSALAGLSPDVRRTIGEQVASVAATRSGALSVGLVISLVVLLWSTSSGMQSLMRALSTAFEREETRGFVRLRVTAILLALAAVAVGAILIAAVAIVPAVLKHFLSSPGLRWALLGAEGLLLLLVLVLVLAGLYRYAPAGRRDTGRSTSVGAVVAAVGMVAFSAIFALYVNLIGNYSKTYGTLAGVVVAMLWLYYSAYVVLLGALVDAERSRPADRSTTPERSESGLV